MPFIRRPQSGTELLLLVTSITLTVMLISPIFHILLRASEAEPQQAFDYFTRTGTLRIIARSLWLVLTVSFASALIGVGGAWLTVRTNLFGRGLWTILLILPLVIPTYVGAFAIVGAIGERGFLQSWLEPFGVEKLPSIYGFSGSWLSITLFTYPYVFLSTRAGLKGLDPTLEDAARMLGRNAWNVFFTVTLPQLSPFILSGTLLVALYTLGEFGAVSVMQYDVFSRAIYFQLSFNRNQAALLSLVLVALTVFVLLSITRTEKQQTYYTRQTSRATKPVKLGYWQIAGQLFCLLVVSLGLVMPLGVIIYWLINGLQEGEALRDVWAPLQRSLRVAALAALACGLGALPLVFFQVRYPSRFSQLTANLVYLSYALPGIVIGLALSFFGARYLLDIEWLALDDYRLVSLMIFGYMVRFLPQVLGTARGGLLQINPQIEESGRILGRRPLGVLLSITLPLMRSSMVAGMALVFLTVMKELPITLMLHPPEYDTLAIRIWSATSEAFYARGAAPALIMVVFSGLSLVFILDEDAKIQ